MLLRHVIGLLKDPKKEWQVIHDRNPSVALVYLTYVMVLATIAPISGYIGTTQFGWSFGIRDPVRLTSDSALTIAVLYYLAMLVSVVTVGKMIQWMGQTYGSHPPLSRCVALAAFVPTPLFLVGVMQLYPLLWLNFVIGLPALFYTIILLYTGVPVLMEIPEERGFLFSSAVLAAGMVALVSMLAVTAMLWGVGIGPAFID